MASPLVQALSFQNSAHPSQSAISPTDVIGAYNLASSVAQKNYEAKLAQQNAKFGGMAQLGGAGIAAFGPKAYTGLMGSAGTAPTTGVIPSMFGAGAKTAADAAAPTQLSSVFGGGATAAAAPPTVAADMAAAASPVDTGGLFSGIFGGAGTAGAGTGTVASDLAAAAPELLGTATADASLAPLAGLGITGAGAGIGDAIASLGLPSWLASALPFLALA